jgi:hypothetical protein
MRVLPSDVISKAINGQAEAIDGRAEAINGQAKDVHV